MENRQGTFIQKMTQLTKKIYYDSLFRVKVILNSEKEQDAWIMGKHYKNKQHIEKAINNIIWLTYRQNIKGMVSSDVGWGCMIRVGQMLMAQTFKKHLKYEQPLTKDNLLHILGAFVDDDEGLNDIGNFSIQKISKMAQREFAMKLGQWHSPNSISYCLKNLHKANPLRGTENLSFYVQQGGLIFDDATKEIGKATNSMLIIVLTMLGLDSVDQQRCNSIKHIMMNKYFNGVIGGTPKKAYYFIGKTNSNFIYLDPHIVHEGSSRKQFQVHLETFFCQYYLSINSNKIHPSMGFCFYVRNIKQLQDLFETLHFTRNNEAQLPFYLGQSQSQVYKPRKNQVMTIIPMDSDEEPEEIGQYVTKSHLTASAFFQPLEDDTLKLSSAFEPLNQDMLTTSIFQPLQKDNQSSLEETWVMDK